MSNIETLKRTTAAAGMSALALVLAVGCGGSFGKAKIRPGQEKESPAAEQTKTEQDANETRFETISVEKTGEEYRLRFDLRVLGQQVAIANTVAGNARQQRETTEFGKHTLAVSSQCLDAECKDFVTLVETYVTGGREEFKSTGFLVKRQPDGSYQAERVQNKYNVDFQNAFDITQYLADKDGWDERRKPMDPVKPLPDHVDETDPGTGGDQPMDPDHEPAGDDRDQE